MYLKGGKRAIVVRAFVMMRQKADFNEPAVYTHTSTELATTLAACHAKSNRNNNTRYSNNEKQEEQHTQQ